jgi:putative transposase
MPRRPRISQPDSIHHITSHGVDTRALFSDDLDRGRFVNLLAALARVHDWRCLSFCLMTTHYHLLVEERHAPLSKAMHLLNSRYSWHVNTRFKRRGHVFEGRYHDQIVTGEAHLFGAVRYIARNARDAGMCDTPEEWRWSSYPALIGLAPAWSFIDSARVLSLFGQERGRAIERVREFVDKVPGTVPGTLVTPDATRR